LNVAASKGDELTPMGPDNTGAGGSQSSREGQIPTSTRSALIDTWFITTLNHAMWPAPHQRLSLTLTFLQQHKSRATEWYNRTTTDNTIQPVSTSDVGTKPPKLKHCIYIYIYTILQRKTVTYTVDTHQTQSTAAKTITFKMRFSQALILIQCFQSR